MGSGRLGKRLVSRLVPSADGAPPPVRAPFRLHGSAGTGHVRDNGRPPDARWTPRYHEGAHHQVGRRCATDLPIILGPPVRTSQILRNSTVLPRPWRGGGT